MRRKKTIALGLAGYVIAWALTVAFGIPMAMVATESDESHVVEWEGYSPVPFVVLFEHKSAFSASSGVYVWAFGWGRLARHTLERTWYPMF